MGRGRRRGPKQLRFRALLDCLAEHVQKISDRRQSAKVSYSLRDCYRSAFAMFYLQDAALLEFQRRFQHTIQKNNLSTVFGVHTIPADTQLRDIIDSHSYEPLRGVFLEYFRRLQRSKLLDGFQFQQGSYLISMDGSEYFGSERIHCPGCLVTERKDETVRYHHQILQATVVNPDCSQVLPLAPEFIRNTDGSTKQDCEIQAGKRLVRKIRSDHPQLNAIILGDSLYSKEPFVRPLPQLRFSFILVAKPNDHKSLFQDIEGLRRGGLLDRMEIRDKKDRLHVYEWVNEIALNGSAKSPMVNFIEYTILAPDGSTNYHSSWVTDIVITEENVTQLVRAGRSRWKIENEGFNTLKNQGYHLEHNFGHGKQYLSEAFFLLNLLAFFFHQIFEMVDGLYQQARARFSARVEFWNAIRACFRLFLFESWDQVLERMNSPPQPAFS